MFAQFVFFFLIRPIFRETSAERDVKIVNVIFLKKMKISCGPWLHLSCEHFDVISIVDNSTGHNGKLFPIC